MSLKIVNSECKVSGGNCLVVVEGDTVEEVTDVTAKRAAFKAAQEMGVPAHGISGATGAYMIGSTAFATAQVSPELVNKVAAECKGPIRFRNDFTLVSSAIVP